MFLLDALSGPIAHVGRRCRACTVGTAEESPTDFDTMAYHSALAVLANRGHGLDRTLEAVEDVTSACGYQFETLVVFVTTHFTSSHKKTFHAFNVRQANNP
jgi:hypothetical protein